MQHVYERILYCKNIDRIIVATSTDRKDDPIAELFDVLEVPVFRGSEVDPLDRYYHAATQYGLGHVVRVMADCPLVDPVVVDEVIAAYFSGEYDFCCLAGEFPVGLDTTVYSYAALKRCWEEARRPSEREHIFPYITSNPHLFNIGSHNKFHGLQHLRWTMDHPADYQLIKTIYEALYEPGKIFLSDDVLAFLETKPHLTQINSGISRDEGIKRAVLQETSLNVQEN